MKKIAYLLFFVLYSSSGFANSLISSISENKILVDTKFQGKNILLFGIKNAVGDIVVLVKGPKKNYIVQKKEKMFGIWLQKKQIEFNNINSFYSIYSTKPLNEIKNQLLLENLNIGIDYLSINTKNNNHIVKIEEIKDFREALIEQKYKDNVYSKIANKANLMGNNLFKIKIHFPKKISLGIYTIETYLIDDEKLSTLQIFPVEVKRTGFEAFIYNLAHSHKYFYAIFCIVAAIIAGFLASVIFWKF